MRNAGAHAVEHAGQVEAHDPVPLVGIPVGQADHGAPARVVHENRQPTEAGRGGVDGETLEEAKRRGPLLVRTRSRAVTAEDYEVLAREAAPDIARVRCVPVGQDAAIGAATQAGTAVRVLLVPAAASEGGKILFENLVPNHVNQSLPICVQNPFFPT